MSEQAMVGYSTYAKGVQRKPDGSLYIQVRKSRGTQHENGEIWVNAEGEVVDAKGDPDPILYFISKAKEENTWE